LGGEETGVLEVQGLLGLLGILLLLILFLQRVVEAAGKSLPQVFLAAQEEALGVGEGLEVRLLLPDKATKVEALLLRSMEERAEVERGPREQLQVAEVMGLVGELDLLLL
jgi:hypothetical protein